MELCLDESFSISSITSTFLSKKPYGQSQDTEGLNTNTKSSSDSSPECTFLHSIPTHVNTIRWNKEDLCSMPHSKQPWMLQRVKWTRFNNHDLNDVEEEPENNLESKHDETKALVGWAISTNVSADNIDKLWESEELNSIFSPVNTALAETGNDDVSFLVQMGAICTQTNQAQAVIRCYNEKGMLQAVVLQEGIAKY